MLTYADACIQLIRRSVADYGLRAPPRAALVADLHALAAGSGEGGGSRSGGGAAVEPEGGVSVGGGEAQGRLEAEDDGCGGAGGDAGGVQECVVGECMGTRGGGGQSQGGGKGGCHVGRCAAHCKREEQSGKSVVEWEGRNNERAGGGGGGGGRQEVGGGGRGGGEREAGSAGGHLRHHLRSWLWVADVTNIPQDVTQTQTPHVDIATVVGGVIGIEPVRDRH
jgi:hypothetical protein